MLVPGGAGFIGRHVVLSLLQHGARVVIGSRDPARSALKLSQAARDCELRSMRFEKMLDAQSWRAALGGIDTVVNCVGILRSRGAETFERIHHLAPAALALACAQFGVRRLVHVSALGLHAGAKSGFLRSKLNGEAAIRAVDNLDVSIVRPSLLDGEGGYGALWLRRVARWPVHFVPADAIGRTAPLDVGDLGEAIARLCTLADRTDLREVDLGGAHSRTMKEHLAALRREHGLPEAMCINVAPQFALLVSHVCDVLHVTPFSFGHLELMRRDNLPSRDLLAMLLGRTPKAIGRDKPARAATEDDDANTSSLGRPTGAERRLGE